MTKNERLQALRILMTVLQENTPLTHLLQADSTITPFTKALCFGVCRHYFRLEKLADFLVSKRPQPLEIWLILLMGLYQLQFLNKPEYVTVQETVALVEKIKKNWAKGLINAVLRRFCRERTEIMATIEKQAAYSLGHPEWLIKKLQEDWPEDWQGILAGNDMHPPLSLRVNALRLSRDNYLQYLNESELKAFPQRHSPLGITLETPVAVTELPGFAAGDVSVQDEAAQLVIPLLELEPGLRVLDACAAPGGKTCHMLEAEPALEECVALDIDPLRIKRIHENLKRLDLKATVIQGDAAHSSSWWDGKLFDRILLDAPCSATGVIRRHPDIKILRTLEEIQSVVEIQARLLQSLWPLLKPGGILVYSTCSIIKQENEGQIRHFLAEHVDCQKVNKDIVWAQDRSYGWQLFPGQNNCDGFFYSVLSKL